MQATSITDENWNVLVSAFPVGWRDLAEESGAVKKPLKDFKSVDDLLRVMLIHIGKGLSLRETSATAKLAGIADVSDVAILKRVQTSEAWLLGLCKKVIAEANMELPRIPLGLNLRMIDASVIKEPGKTGSQWRLHYSLSLPDLRCDAFEITPCSGVGTGETFTRFNVQPGDYIVGDRIYSTTRGIQHIHDSGGFVLVRVNQQAIKFYNDGDSQFDLLSHLQSITEPMQQKEWCVRVKTDDGSFIKGRVCAVRKSEESINQAHRKLHRSASKKQREVQLETFEFAKYVVVFSTFPVTTFPTNTLLECYRLRWQIELIFKRLKSLMGLGHLPKKDPASSRAWLYGKLFLALLSDKLARISRAFSPWGYTLPKPLARI